MTPTGRRQIGTNRGGPGGASGVLIGTGRAGPCAMTGDGSCGLLARWAAWGQVAGKV